MFSQDLVRDRGKRIQITWRSASSNLSHFGASSFFLARTRTQRRLLRLCILAVEKLHLILWMLSYAMQKNLVQ